MYKHLTIGYLYFLNLTKYAALLTLKYESGVEVVQVNSY
jgi:hypothetical protein